jgi:hypothetical protein
VSAPQISANPIPGIPAISIVDQSLQNISRAIGLGNFRPFGGARRLMIFTLPRLCAARKFDKEDLKENYQKF